MKRKKNVVIKLGDGPSSGRREMLEDGKEQRYCLGSDKGSIVNTLGCRVGEGKDRNP